MDYTGTFVGTLCDFSTMDWPLIGRRFKSRTAPDGAAFPGLAITQTITDNETRKRTLMGVVAQFAEHQTITPQTLKAVCAFIDALPVAVQLPKVSPDGEGGLQMAWSKPGQPRTLVTVAEWVLHTVDRAGSNEANYLPDMPFYGVVPEELLQVIAA